jgi:EAL and modified HD-GYP domain-containing signal transduction protein
LQHQNGVLYQYVCLAMLYEQRLWEEASEMAQASDYRKRQ